jgi:acetyl esterase/lipase
VTKTTLDAAYAQFNAASPMSHIGPGAPPFFVSHGTNDGLVPVEQARLFVARLRSVARQPVVYAELPRAQHAFDMFGTPRATFAAEAVGRFLGVAYGDYLARNGSARRNTADTTG